MEPIASDLKGEGSVGALKTDLGEMRPGLVLATIEYSAFMKFP